MPLSERQIKKLKPPKRGNVSHSDGELPGFGVCVTAAGVVSYFLNYRFRGRERRLHFGRWPEMPLHAAREEAIALRAEIRRGHDPLEMRARDRLDSPTLKQLADEYLERHARLYKRESSVRGDEAMLQGIILPRLGRLRVSVAAERNPGSIHLAAITRRDVESLHASLQGTPYRANRVLALLSKMFSLSLLWGWRQDNPAAGVKKFAEQKRTRWLNAQEVGRLLRALQKEPDRPAAQGIELLLHTGSRKSEVLAARWGEFDLKLGRWTKPSHHTKQKREETTPLSRAALSILRRMRREAGAGAANPKAFLLPW